MITSLFAPRWRTVWLCLLLLVGQCVAKAATTNPEAISQLLNRIGGDGTADRFVTVVDASLSTDGNDVFLLTSHDGKPCIKGNTTLSVATGINWYLNHVAHVNLTWNNLTTNLAAVSLPAPAQEERHTCHADYRYYLNYCTFSYSMSTWTWERWQQEIDWMALHGINMPLQIVGLDVVWYKLLTQDLGYTEAEANNFIAGPCFQAWWGMNNLEGWGGPNPAWWYTRQEQLCKKILERQRELGMEPVLPGYSGMVPSDITTKGYTANNQGNWCSFVRPYILDPNSQAFTDISAKYYARLAEVMGTSTYYSMDPFHEGANTEGIDVPSAYKKIAKAMLDANSEGKWVIQFWQWSGAQYNVLSQVEQGKLIVLDLFSDAHTHFGSYQGHDAVYCMLANFGGRTGLFGRLSKIMTDYFACKSNNSNIKGIGATPEAIEQVPVLYDALFELPWRSQAPDPQAWLADYTVSRYGADNAQAKAAWEKIRNSALNCGTALQGPQEAVLCARPSLQVNSVSSWGGTEIFYNAQDVAAAANLLLEAKDALSGANYSYDLTDFTRQAMTDYGYYLLKAIKSAYDGKQQERYATCRDAYLQLMLDLDELLCTNSNFMLGRWTQMARGIADEVAGTTEADRQWLELNNARTLITTWGNRNSSEWGGLRDYSYREWGGMLKDFYYERWKTYFRNLDNNTSQPDWFENDWAWAHNASKQYADQPVGSTTDVAAALLGKYFLHFTSADGSTYHIYRYLSTDARSQVSSVAYRGESFTFPLAALPQDATATVGIDFNNDGRISADETASGLQIAVPMSAVTGKVAAQLTLSDGTEFKFTLMLKDLVTEARTVTVSTADAAQGTVSLEGTTSLSVTTTDEVTMTASPVSGYDFYQWTDKDGQPVSTDNPYTYYGAAAADFVAHFLINKWGKPTEDRSEWNTMRDYGQYLSLLEVSQNGGEAQQLYTADACPASLCQTTRAFKAPQGSKFTLHWKDTEALDGLSYCRLSAYIDLNADGDFDDEGEFLAVMGDKASAGNTMLSDGTLSVLLPYDVAEGTTHLRIRFDSSWKGGLDANTDAMPAKASTTRMVYDIPVHITTQAATACTVTVKTSDVSKGTVDANGQPDTYTYAVGEDVVLRAYPAAGYKVQCWKDQYDREVPASWMDGSFLRFRAPESGTYTAYFVKAIGDVVTLGNYTFSYTDSQNELTLTKALSGEGELVIPDTYSDFRIVGLAHGALQSLTGLTSLQLPASVTSLGTDNVVFTTNFKGAGVQNAPIALANPLKGDAAWQIAIDVQASGESFNQWGSGLLATGNDALAASYNQGFQLYLKADGSIILKLGSSEKKTFSHTKGYSAFSLLIERTASQALTVSVTAGGTTDTYTETGYALTDIALFSTALKEGMNLQSITITDPTVDTAPFRGCTALAQVVVDAANPHFKSIDGVLYDAAGATLLAYPEGKLAYRFTLPATVSKLAAYAFTAAPALQVIESAAATPATASATTFGTCTARAQVAPASAAAYRTAWSLPLLFSVAADARLSAAESALLQSGDAVCLHATAQTSATAEQLPAGVALWWSATLPTNRLYPIAFPTELRDIRLSAQPEAMPALGDLRLYTYADGAFTRTMSVEAGAALMGLPEAWHEQEFILQFGALPATQPAVPGFAVNASADELPVSQAHYVYDAPTNTFTLATGSTTLQPLGAVLLHAEGMPESLNGPADVVTGISQATLTDGCPQGYDPSGRAIGKGYKGIYVNRQGVHIQR